MTPDPPCRLKLKIILIKVIRYWNAVLHLLTTSLCLDIAFITINTDANYSSQLFWIVLESWCYISLLSCEQSMHISYGPHQKSIRSSGRRWTRNSSQCKFIKLWWPASKGDNNLKFILQCHFSLNLVKQISIKVDYHFFIRQERFSHLCIVCKALVLP